MDQSRKRAAYAAPFSSSASESARTSSASSAIAAAVSYGKVVCVGHVCVCVCVCVCLGCEWGVRVLVVCAYLWCARARGDMDEYEITTLDCGDEVDDEEVNEEIMEEIGIE